MIELTALKWINIPGRGLLAEIAPAQLGDQTIQVGDHVLIDGAEKRIAGIEFVDYVSPRVANLALLLTDPH
ncbi:hypothetical protein JYB55_24515 [Mycolicibacterium septicum]|nr:hypothetical protein [Mycolicibacterium septicum]